MVWACASCGGENPEGTRFCGHCGAAQSTEAAPSREESVTQALTSFVSAQVADRLVATGGNITEERRLVTALFADLSGFTPLADRLDPEQLLEVIDPVIEAMTNVVGRYEGYVDKFAGDALLAFFGAPVAHEDDAARALLVSMEMHRELKGLLRRLPPDAGHLTLHTGVNSGYVIARITGSDVRMDYSVLGDAVILAQRLESAAPAGETYVGETTYRLTKSRFEFEPVGELTLKGKAKPVTAWRLIGERRQREQRREQASGRFVGRERELARLRATLQHVGPSGGRVVTVTGEPGIGKSRLAAETKRAIVRSGHRWLETRCLSYGAGIAYWPYMDLLRRLVGIEVDDPPQEAARRLSEQLVELGLGHRTPYFARLLGLPASDDGIDVSSLEPEAFRRGLHESLVEAIVGLSSGAPVIVAIEDFHWADTSSIDVTAEIARVTTAAPVALFLSARPEAKQALRDIATSADPARWESVELGPLDGAHIEDLIAAIVGGRASAALTRLVADKSSGNPFFAEELVLSLNDRGFLRREADGWSVARGWDEGSIPPTVEGLLAARIDALPIEGVPVLQVASVIGRRVRLPLLHAVVGDVAGAEAGLEQLTNRGLLDVSDEDGHDTLVFHHALVQDVAYSRLLRKHRRALHRRVAAAAEALYGAGDDVIELLARHLYLGHAGAKAIDYLTKAGERAARLFANEEAATHLERAAELAAADAASRDRLPGILVALADLYELRGDYEQAAATYGRVKEQTGDLRAWRGLISIARKTSKYEEALGLIQEAFAVHDHAAPATAALWLERGWVLSKEGRFAEAKESFHRGLELAEDGSETMGELLLQLTRAEGITGDWLTALDYGLRAQEIFEARGDLRGLAAALRINGDAYRDLQRPDDAARALRRGLELAERIGSVEEVAGSLINLGLVEFERGSIDQAIRCDERAIREFERVGLDSGRAIGYGNLAEKLLAAGRIAEAVESSNRALEIARLLGDSETIADVLKTRAALHIAQGELEQAAVVAQEAASLYETMDARPFAVEALALAAEAYERIGDRAGASEIASKARSLEPS